LIAVCLNPVPNNSQPATNNRRTYLVTGVAGFIASKVAEQLLAAGHTVVGLDNLNDYYDVRLKLYRLARLAELAGLPAHSSKLSAISDQVSASIPRLGAERLKLTAVSSARFTFEPVDIENLAALEEVFYAHKFDAVFNLAARAGVRYSMENPFVYLSTNSLGTLNILECMRKHGVKKQVLASTSSLYAGCPMPFTEDQPVNTPLSPYAATKKAAELLAYSYHKLYGLDTTVVRYFTVFGPAGRPDMSIFRFIKWIDEGKPLELFGDGSQSRDFTYVDDIARGTILAGKLFGGQMTEDGGQPSEISGLRSQVSGLSAGLQPGFEIINLGGGRNPISLQVVIAFIEKALGKKALIAGKPFHIADIKETWADISKAERLLGWKPQVSPEEGFQRSVDWYRANRSWLSDIQL
jgi:UDP-glucuronate 4-epimerase